MGRIILNEREFVEHALEHNDLGDKASETLGRVARYYAGEGYGKREIQVLLEEFLLKCDPGASVTKWSTLLESMAKTADKFPLVEIDEVPITRQELDTIASIPGRPAQRVAFTLLCVAKYRNMVNPKNNNWATKDDKEVFRMANVQAPIRRQSLMFNELMQRGLIRYSTAVDNLNINVCFIDNDGEPVLHISDFRNLGYQYLRYTGEPYIECEVCGLVVKKTNNRQKYCPACAVEVHRKRASDGIQIA